LAARYKAERLLPLLQLHRWGAAQVVLHTDKQTFRNRIPRPYQTITNEEFVNNSTSTIYLQYWFNTFFLLRRDWRAFFKSPPLLAGSVLELLVGGIQQARPTTKCWLLLQKQVAAAAPRSLGVNYKLLFKNIQEHSRTFKNIQEHSRTFKNIHRFFYNYTSSSTHSLAKYKSSSSFAVKKSDLKIVFV
jgi:hypothetical protein